MFSVVYTDVINGILITIGTILSLFFLVQKVGGVSEVITIAEATGKWDLFGNWSLERVGTCLWAVNCY